MVHPTPFEHFPAGNAERERVVTAFGTTHASVARSLLGSRAPSLRQLGRTSLCLFRMLVAKDFPLSTATVALIVATLAYFISPFDLVPDSLALVGYLDDALLVAEVGILLSADIARWNARETAPPALAAE